MITRLNCQWYLIFENIIRPLQLHKIIILFSQTWVKESKINQIGHYYLSPVKVGRVKCVAKNTYSETEELKDVTFNDLDNKPITIWSSEASVGDTQSVSVTCAASSFKYLDQLSWIHNGEMIETSESKF